MFKTADSEVYTVSIRIKIDLAKSPHVDLDSDNALKLLECISEEAWVTRDLDEAIRIIENFDEFYKYMKRKFEDYITPPKNPSDSILGKVIVHKLRLYYDDDKEMVEIIFDRRFPVDKIKTCLERIGYKDVQVEKQVF